MNQIDKTPNVPVDDRDPVDLLAEEFAERLRRGEHPSVSDYATAHPDHAEQLRELLPAVAQMECLKRFRRATGLDGAPALPDRFGDFRIVRELGRGGMGVVFEAVQESLGRPVALKVLASHSQYDGIRRERFIREAHAAARLHHSNIVPVFGVGEQDNIPYYVMQLIRGQGLNALVQHWKGEHGRDENTDDAPSTVPIISAAPIRKTKLHFDDVPTPDYGNWRFAAEVGLQAAEALHYAHKQGVLHRDIKPANVLLDSTRRVWITDFGLAKVVDLNGITASGDILGTLQYLAPECLAGDSDPRSDVYGVGATLYELLTLIPPYPPDTPARMLKQVSDTDPVPLRAKNPAIPIDLETIVLKAMAREPDHRYVSARELAHDLQAFLDDRPIKARRQTWTDRLWRWCRRNRALAILTPVVVAALVLAGAGGWIGYARTQSALEAENRRLVEEEKARKATEAAMQRLDDNLTLSLATFEAVFEAAGGNRPGFGIGALFARPDRPGPGGLGGPRGPGPRDGGPEPKEGDPGPGGHGPGGSGGPGGGPGVPGFGPTTDALAKAAMLETILNFYDKFAEKNSTDSKLQFEAAKAHRRVGEARVWVERSDKAAGNFVRAIALLRTLRAQDPDDPRYGYELAQTYVAAPLNTPGADENTLVESLDFARAHAGKPPAGIQPQLVGLLAFKLGVVREKKGDPIGAEAAFRNAIAELSPADRANDTRSPPVVTDQAWVRYALAALLAKTNRAPEACDVLRELLDELQRVPERSGYGSLPQQDAAYFAHEQLAVLYEQLGDRANAALEAQIARDMRQMKGPPGGPGGHGPGGPKGPPRKQ